MYWFRTDNPILLIPWLLVLIFWLLGGWLMATHLYRLERHERLGVGFGLGLAIYLWLANLFGHWLSPEFAFSGAGLAVLIIGIACAWNEKQPWLDWRDFQVWPGILAGLALLVVFLLISRGLAIFDEPKNLTIISQMAVGDIPPHYYMNADYYFRYHYGFQLLGATLMRLGGLFPWSASDLAKSIVFAYALFLGALLGKRFIRHPIGVLGIPFILAFASGTRYLLMLLPTSFLQRLDPLINLQGTSAQMKVPFSQSLFQGWILAGGPPHPFQFGFLNGIFPPMVMSHAGSYTLSFIIMGLILLLSQRQRNSSAILVLAVLLAMWGLTWESSYGLFAIGIAIVALYKFWQCHFDWRELLGLDVLALALSIPLVCLQGGTITEIVRKVLFNSASAGIGVEGIVGSSGFSMRWPPAVFSAHLGALDITNPLTAFIAICEMGPVILLVFWISCWAMKHVQRGDRTIGALSVSAWVGLIGPPILVYQAERDISRFTGHSLLIWTLFLGFMVGAEEKSGKVFRLTGIAALALMVMSGLATFRSELSAINQPVLGLTITGLDARIARDTWERLTKDSLIFDSNPWRASALTGLKTRAAIGNIPTSEWLDLYQQPSLERLLEVGYNYVYMDDLWWQMISSNARASLSLPCVRIRAEYWDNEKIHFRRLLDLMNCSQ